MRLLETLQLGFRLSRALRSNRPRSAYDFLEQNLPQRSRARTRAVQRYFILFFWREKRFWTILECAAKEAGQQHDWVTVIRIMLYRIALEHFCDSRDGLVALALIWRQAEERGIDPAPHFSEIGTIAIDSENYLNGRSAKHMIEFVASSAEYRAKLLPKHSRTS